MELTRIKPLLVPAAWVLVGALVLLQIASLIALVTGRGVVVGDGAAWLPALLALVVGLAVAWGGEGPRARSVAMTALVVCVIAVLLLLAAGGVVIARVIGTTTTWAVLTQGLVVLSALAVQLLAVVGLGRILPLTAVDPAAGALALPATHEPEAPTGQAPRWQPDRAVGAHWHSAGAAAAGAAAADWGRPGEQSGWAPGTPAVTGGEPMAEGSGAVAGTPPRPPEDFGPRARHAAPDEAARVAGTQDPDVTRAVPDAGKAMDLGPQAIARRYVEGGEDPTRSAPPGGRRQPPAWTPLEDPTQPPPKE